MAQRTFRRVSMAAARIVRPVERVVVARGEHYEGDLPPPELLERFARLMPGSETVFLAELEREAAHRRKIELDTIERRATLMTRAQIGGLLVAVSSIFAGAYVLVNATTLAGQIGGFAIVLIGIGGAPVARIVAQRYRAPRQ